MTYADLLRPRTRPLARLYDLAAVVGGSLLVALAAQIALPLPFSPVPVTAQTLAVLLVGVVLGARRGAAALLLYLAQGALGLPVFAAGGAGLPHLLGPTGGYLVGFVLAAALMGNLATRGWDRHPLHTAIAMLLGNAVIYAVGLPWLALFVGPDRALPLGLYPFVVGDLIKLALATVLLPAAWRLLGREGDGTI